MRRRTFLRLSAGAVGARVLRVRAAPSCAALNARVVIVGGGFAGAACALSLRRMIPSIGVTVVDPDDPYVTCPMSNSVLAGLRGFDSITVRHKGLQRAGARYVRARVASIDPQKQRVHLDGGGALAYDRLVVAPGIRFLWGKPEGYDAAAAETMPHAWQAGGQTRLLAAQLRAMRDGGVVAISVPAGPMRCPPGPFERASLMAACLKPARPRCKVLIFDSNNHFPRQDVFMDAWQSLYPGMIEWIPVTEGGAVERVETARNMLFTSHGEQRVDVANIIPPQAPALLAAQTGLATDHGWCPVDPQTFESSNVPRVHVIGDACIAEPMPKSASAAAAQAAQCALAIGAKLEERELPAGGPALESVCYSMLARGLALSIHARFELADGALRQLPRPEDAVAVPRADEARNAERWYRRIVHDSFGA